ncbi:MAG: LytR/AlgR family response regulator transcription factor [Bacilli bacterium]
MMLKVAICDDDTFTCSEIERIIFDFESTSTTIIDVEVFYSGEKLISFLKNEHHFDLIFLDIELRTISGIQVGSTIRNDLDDHLSKIVFITSKVGYEQQLFDLQPLNFIKKPIDKSKLLNCILLALKLKEVEQQTFQYKKGYDYFNVKIKDIIYFESQGKQVKIVTHTTEDTFYETLENIKKRLPKVFVESHRAFIVNFNKIEHITNQTAYLVQGLTVPISQRSIKNIRSMLIENEREKLNGR